MTGLKPEDDLVIRWTTWSVFGGEERWRSEGVQIGGLKSARGILGNWFDKDFDRHGPGKLFTNPAPCHYVFLDHSS